MIKTTLLDLIGVGLKHPIIQGGMGPFETPRLAAAVSSAGGLGIISHWGIVTDPYISCVEKVKQDIEYMKNQSQGPFGVNIRVARIEIEAMDMLRAVLEARERDAEVRRRLRVVITSAGSPKPPAEEIRKRDHDLLHFHVTPTLYHAKKGEEAKCDAVVAAGYEGGGHQSYEEVNTMVLIPEVVNSIKIPVIASGGFCDGKGLAAALAMGAIGVQMGTRFIATQECEFHPKYKEGVLKAQDKDTAVVQGAFGPIRLLKNRYLQEHSHIMTKEERLERESTVSLESIREEIKKYELVYRGDIENGAAPCGESCGSIHDIPTVQELIERIIGEAEDILHRFQAMNP
jgi:NAD(P)H-dependent flavin oxidoreductase YrpB (nitropropane dioxygenase family)